ncbi:MAG: FtsK/SpoIIIE domain-containing protein [Verrucomicrobiota bacterium]
MNSQPGVIEMLALLDALKSVVSDFVAREEKLNSEFRVQCATELNLLAAQSQAQEAAAHAQETQALSALAEAKARLQSRFEKRRTRINRAHAEISRRILDAISRCDTEWKERTQQGVQAAELRRTDELAGAAAAHDHFQQQLGSASEELARLETAALSGFRGYARFRRRLTSEPAHPEQDLAADENTLFSDAQQLLAKVTGELNQFAKLPFPKIFKFLPVWPAAGLLLGVGVADPVLTHFGHKFISDGVAGLALTCLIGLLALYFMSRRSADPVAASIANDLTKIRRQLVACAEKSAARLVQEQARIKTEFETTKQTFHQEWRQAVREISQLRGTQPAVIDAKASRLGQKTEQWLLRQRNRLETANTDTLACLKTDDRVQTRKINETHKSKMTRLEEVHQQRWQELAADWTRQLAPLCDRLRAANEAAEKLFPSWESLAWKSWTPPAEFPNAAKFGHLEAEVEKLVGVLPKDVRLRWPGPATVLAPLALVFPTQGSLLFETGKNSGEEAFGVINNIIFRLLSATPPGKLSFTIFDPVGLGQNFSALTHLADYEGSSINSRIWTQTAQFEEKLAELNEHMEKIIQMYLRNEYATIAEYNAQAGSVAEKYHFLVIASFPANFSDTAAKRLRNIAASGARCGVFTLIHWDQRTAQPPDFVPDELRKNSIGLIRKDQGFELTHWRSPGVRLKFDPPPPAEVATEFLRRVGADSRQANRVEVPFSQIAPAETGVWQEETGELLRVPIGRSGATKWQYLEIGSGTRQHALIAGKTGSGKSTLFHVIITNLALRCSPEQVEFYLVDFKKGVEFKCYGSRRLPHARVVAIESDREFGLSVLQRVDDELRRRGDLFRKMGAQDLAGYKRIASTLAAPCEAVPRTLLLIDEFQEFFTEEDRISQGAAVLLDRIVRQGRAFGIHVILGSQTLGGAYTLARATIGQMVIRIALQCNEADACLIMDQDNPAPRLLSRPGEGIYNDAAGALEGNSPFQAVWLSDKTRDNYLAAIRRRADQCGDAYPGPLVFEGNAPADVRENLPLGAALQRVPASIPNQAAVWLGAPNSIKGPTAAVFRRQSGSHLLVVSQSEERTATLLSVALVSLAAQFPRNAAHFVVLDNTPAGFPQRECLERLLQAVPHTVVSAGNGNLMETMAGLAEELKQRADNETAGPEIFVLVHGLQNFKKLRAEDEFGFSSSDSAGSPTPAATLLNLITEGSARGFHLVATCDTYNNVSRFLGRKTLSEFEMRVVFQMSASDSASLIDAPAAASLGLHRALYYNDREGSLETFRPYAQPDGEWLESVTQQLQARK